MARVLGKADANKITRVIDNDEYTAVSKMNLLLGDVKEMLRSNSV